MSSTNCRAAASSNDCLPCPGTVRMNGLIWLTLLRYPPREFLGRSGREGTGAGRLAVAGFALIWLPAVFCLASAAAGGMPWQADPDGWVNLVVLVPAARPLALAFDRLLRRGRRVAAWSVFAVLAPLTTLADLAPTTPPFPQ